MARLFKKKSVQPLPEGAEVFTRRGEKIARWVDGRGEKRTAPVREKDGALHVEIERGGYIARFRDAGGVVREISTGCADMGAAQAFLNDLLRREEQIKAGILNPLEARMAEHQKRPLSEHAADFIASLQGRGASPAYRVEAEARLNRLIDDSGWKRLADMTGASLERWIAARERDWTAFEREGKKVIGKDGKPKKPMASGTIQTHVRTGKAFGNWLYLESRLNEHPFARVRPKAGDPVKVRRALDPQELQALIEMAAERPLREALLIRREGKKVKPEADPKPETRARLIRLGHERALTWKVLAMTGLRVGELRAVTVGQVRLDADPAHIAMRITQTKNKRASLIPLRADLASDLKSWIGLRVREAQEAAESMAQPIPTALEPNARLLDIPDNTSLLRILQKDLKAAGIPIKNEHGQSLDVHALRHSYSTLLAVSGAPVGVHKDLMRHSSADLSLSRYSHIQLGESAKALDRLPALSLDSQKFPLFCPPMSPFLVIPRH